GFDPWPEDEPDELDKVKFLYSECVRKKIPLTVHCSDGGFKTTPEAFRHTNPERWIKVLNNSSFKNLKINFAHMGSMAGGNDKWLQTIMKLISKYDNVYTDFSFITPKPDNYERIKKIINNKSLTRLLFGSDFIINLLRSGSYNEYISAFLTTPYLTSDQKADICNNNPEKFLFG
ncbi:MAG TPA: amidohydrolase family protein, partial [Bacteroidales bacterium]|nr:amidohydrolase family protein [Bacteroidales bacterium]